MADFKCVFNFFSTGKKGGTWSEVWYRSAGSLQSAATFDPALILARMLLAHPLTQLSKIRVSQVGSPRVTTIVTMNAQGVFIGGTGPAPIDSAIVCNVSSSAVPATRRWWLRGWDASMATRNVANGNDVFAGVTTISLSAWFNALANFGFEVLPLVKPAVGVYSPYSVTKVDGTVPGKTVLTASGPIVTIPGVNQIIAARFSKKDLPGLQGPFTILSSVGGTITIPYSTPGNTVVVPSTGQFKMLSYVSGATIDPAISGPAFIGSRQTKSPFTGSRGARSANRKLRLSP